MLKLIVNRARLDLRIEPVTPLLVKSGDKALSLLHPELPDLAFVRTRRQGIETVYVPGSSVKGVVRSASERVLRSLDRRCCDPLEHKSSCQEEASRLGDAIARDTKGRGPHPQAAVYRKVCYACRTFGSQAIASRVAFADAYPPDADHERTNRTERRSSVAIDRKSGGPAGGKLFESEIVTGGGFETSIDFTNVELWQLALVGIVLRDIEAGLVRFGSTKSRGLGHVRIVAKGATFEQTDPAMRLQAPAGVAALRGDLARDYDLVGTANDVLTGGAGGDATRSALGTRWVWSGHDAVLRLLDASAGAPWQTFCAGAAAEGA